MRRSRQISGVFGDRLIGVYCQIRPRMEPHEDGAIHTMECPVCVALNREHSRECEVEATAILKERSGWVGTYRPAFPGSYESINDAVLTSRKRQMRITLRLNQHKAAAHSA